MLERQSNMCDVPVVSLTRRFRTLGLTSQITEIPQDLRELKVQDCVLDLRGLSKISASEAVALAEVLAHPRQRRVMGLCATDRVLTQLNDYGIDRLVNTGLAPLDIMQKQTDTVFRSTSALLLCGRPVPSLGPLGQIDAATLMDPAGQTPWIDNLARLVAYGCKDITIAVPRRNVAAISAFRSAVPSDIALRFQFDQGSAHANAIYAYDGGLGWDRDILLLDAWSGGDFDLIPLCHTARIFDVRAASLNSAHWTDTEPAAAVLTKSTMLGGAGVAWNWQDLDQRKAVSAPDLMDLSNPAQYAQHFLKRNTTKVIRKSIIATGRNFIAATAHLGRDAELHNAIILPDAAVANGAVLRNIILGPDWAIRYSTHRNISEMVSLDDLAALILPPREGKRSA
ncbi:MAG: hypothetical protein ACPG5U_08965 [Planktomarina sp.]